MYCICTYTHIDIQHMYINISIYTIPHTFKKDLQGAHGFVLFMDGL